MENRQVQKACIRIVNAVGRVRPGEPKSLGTFRGGSLGQTRPTVAVVGNTGGFTLIEVLVAMTIFATVLVAVNTVFFGALRLRTATTRIVEEAVPVNHALAVIKSDLRSVLAPGGTLAGTITGGILMGGMSGSTNNSLVGIPGGVRSELPTLQINTTTGITDDSTLTDPNFAGLANVASVGTPALNMVRPWSETQKIAYFLRDPIYSTNLLGKELVRAVTRNLLPSVQDFPIQQTLLDGIEDIAFLFYDGSMWLESWDASIQSNAVPQAIKVAIAFAAESQTSTFRKPPVQLVVPIMAQARTTNQVSSTETSGTTGGQEQGGGAATGGGAAGGGATTPGGQPTGQTGRGGATGGGQGGGATGGGRR